MDDTVVLELRGRTAVTLQMLDEQFSFNGSAYVQFIVDGGTFWLEAPRTGAGIEAVDDGPIDGSNYLYQGSTACRCRQGRRTCGC